MEIAYRVPSEVRKTYIRSTKKQESSKSQTAITKQNLDKVKIARRIKVRKGQDVQEVTTKRNTLCKQLYEDGCAEFQNVYDDVTELKELIDKHHPVQQPTTKTYTEIEINKNVPDYLRQKLADKLGMHKPFTSIILERYIHFGPEEREVFLKYRLHTNYRGALRVKYKE